MSECPYCLTPIVEDAATAACEACGAIHHQECWEENRGCCVRSCARVSRNTEIDVAAAGADTLELSRQSIESARPHKRERVSNPCMNCGKQLPDGELYCPECEPGPPEDQDSRNVGPILIMLAVLAILVGLVLVGALGPLDETSPAPTQTETQRSR